MVRILSLLALFISVIPLSADTDTATRILDRRFRTLKTEVEGDFMAPPVIRMGTQDRIVITFDEIGEDNSYLEYRLIHCNSDWQPSRLIESEYISGFNSARIDDYAFSQSTFVHYVNYLITLPNEDMQILHSGNYLLQVYDPDDPETTLMQTRFQVTENIAYVEGASTSRTDRGHNTEWQQVAFSIDHEALGDINAYQDLIVEVTRNLSDDTRRPVRSPLRVERNRAYYDHMPDLVFPASNEYRRFESVSNAFPGMNVDSLRYMGTNYHVWLRHDEERASRQYSHDVTQHGRFIVREYNATDSNVGADYITVHFTLDFPKLTEGDIYVDGEFTHGLYNDFNRMRYDPATGLYTAEIPLKQGAYNYQYVIRGHGAGAKADPAPIEGNKYETDNEFSVSVFFRPPGARADRLISHAVLHPL